MDSGIKQLRYTAVIVLAVVMGCASGNKPPKVAYRAPVSDINPSSAHKAAAKQIASTATKPWYSAPPAGAIVSKPAPIATSTVPAVSKAAPVLPKGAVSWQWPASGKIIGNFSSQNAQKGIDIAGQNGQPVMTAAPGVVVYSGSGLRGYGQMVIVKHNDQYLSAYAHNSRLLVKEGDTVKAGSKIAEMGQTDTESVRLHFEIRKNGQPVDPMGYLPRRG